MRILVFSAIYFSLSSGALAQDCASILDRATANVNEREVKSADVNDWMSDVCSKSYNENSSSSGKSGSASVSYAGFGLGGSASSSKSKTSISLNELCDLHKSNQRNTFVERIYSQNVQSDFFAAYDSCLDSESPLVFALKNDNDMRTAVVNVSSRAEPIKYSIRIDGPGADSLSCYRHDTGTKIDEIDFSNAELDGVGFKFTCNHKPQVNGDTRTYSPAVVSIATNAYSVSDKIITIPFSGSTYVVGESLEKLNSEIRDLRVAVKGLSEKDLEMSQKIVAQHELSDDVKIWTSEWIEIKKNEKKTLNHGLGSIPEITTIWFAASANPNETHLMSSILSRGTGGYGSFITNVTDTKFDLTAGIGSSTSSYGHCESHWKIFNENAGECTGTRPANSSKRFVRISFLSKTK